ncbi:MAG: glycosyltransferase family 2 protein [Lachnospiraceae bacterium]|nr:glycosyltransferase family 2 protein [Lachnospiraceae bacterium]
MKENLVSIITPMYNAQQYIQKTIKSVQAQTYTEWEMLIVDDCSDDRSGEIVLVLAEQDPRIKYYRNSARSGVAGSRNYAISRAQGRYLAFLDSDDLWKPHKLECQIAFMKEKDAGFSYGMCEVIDENGRNLRKDRRVPERVDYKQLLKGNVIPCLTVVIDKKIMPDVKMPEIPHEDYAAWLTLLRQGGYAYGMQNVLAQYRVSNHTVSSNKIKAMRWTWRIYRNYMKLPVMKSVFYFCAYVWKAVWKHF